VAVDFQICIEYNVFTIGMLAIKFQRVGRRHQPAFRVVVAEKRSKRDGPPVEDLGFYNPLTKEGTLKKERLQHWLTVGAQPTVGVHNLLVRFGVTPGPKIAVKLRPKKKEEAAKAAPPVSPTPAGTPSEVPLEAPPAPAALEETPPEAKT
jgi:small subunit ribosomal protein S16